ncbi:MAG TPA: hypothetical protein VFH39_01585 [Candidatus Saccharimonadales bacterium]|nr:hypothetical protein [Candidatus Saccharimonadales bacterium]
MADKPKKTVVQRGGAGGIWFMGAIGTLVYFLHFHSGTFWLVILAIIKAILWPGFLLYYVLRFMHI